MPIPMDEHRASWGFDFAQLDSDLAASGCRALVLVNPHNPTGKVFTAEELDKLGYLARRHDLLVISDEIHSDLVFPPHKHIPIASLPGMAERTVTLNSASKGFNLAGVRCAIAHIGPERLRQTWDSSPPTLYGSPNIFGVTATLAAWQHGDTWLSSVVDHLDRQRHLLVDSLKREVPGTRHRKVEAGYLAWIDFRNLSLGSDPAEFLLTNGKVALQSGAAFTLDDHGRGFARLNFATSSGLLHEIISRISHACTQNGNAR
jgi:cystathionine beta-lyase